MNTTHTLTFRIVKHWGYYLTSILSKIGSRRLANAFSFAKVYSIIYDDGKIEMRNLESIIGKL